MEKDLARRQEEADALKMKLRSLDDYDEMKRELEILKVDIFLGIADRSILNFRLLTMMILIEKILPLQQEVARRWKPSW
jgi:hypothetical protein